MKNIKLNFYLITAIIIISSFNLLAQTEITVGTDFVSRYIWRGTDFGSSPSIQPTLALVIGGL